MALRGDLKTFSLISLLQILNNEEKTGRLKISTKANVVQIMLQDGEVVFATESRKTNRIGLLLLNNGLIDQHVLDSCLALSRQKNQVIGKTLVQEGHITTQELNDFLMKQAENTIYNVLLWESGVFEFEDMQLNLERLVGKRFNTMNILMEASRRIDELAVLKKEIPSDQAVVRRVTGQEAERAMEFKEEELRLLAMVDGTSTVRQILEQTGYDDFTGYQIINVLMSSGQISLLQPMGQEELAQQALSQFQGVDNRQFRETLDYLGLSRSSVLRLVLTRLFRDALGPAELLERVDVESQKIAGTPDQAKLGEIRDGNRAPVLSPVLELLWQATSSRAADK